MKAPSKDWKAINMQSTERPKEADTGNSRNTLPTSTQSRTPLEPLLTADATKPTHIEMNALENRTVCVV